ncbi:hypothetical protein [Gordonia sp. CPCC 205333]|uniref:hypothetical protein n=1 Tax=Gordonia sp. CPCC 205333 TaxID=3140790 RepID=UPI003AF37ABD
MVRPEWRGRLCLSDLIGGPPQARDATQPALASELYFMFSADPDFTTEHILPLFREDPTANLAWNPYLHYPRYDDKLLAAGFLDGVFAEWDRLPDLGQSGLQRQFFGLTASIVSFAGITQAQRQELLNKSVLADSGAHAVDFAESVVRLISTDKIDGAELWNRWLREHLTARLNGLPRNPGPEELARWADAVPYLGSSLGEALGLLSGRDIGFGERFRVPVFPEGVLETSGPALAQHYAERIRNSVPGNHFCGYQVKRLVETLNDIPGGVSAAELALAANNSGFI